MSTRDDPEVLSSTDDMTDPEFLYRYQEFDIKKVERIFTHNELYFTSPSAFNDPFDCRVNIDFRASRQEYRDYLIRHLKKTRPDLNNKQRRAKVARAIREGRIKDTDLLGEIERYIQDGVNEIGVLCLSAVPDHILMWSHYSDGHEGFCLEFRATGDTPFFGAAVDVKYSRSYKAANFFRSPPDELSKLILLTKADVWSYEREWRILEFAGHGEYPFPGEHLTGVILGCRMPDKFKEKITEWCMDREKPPQLYQAKEKEAEYGLDIIPID